MTRVTLVVAMRNEEDNIEACLRALVEQDYGIDNIEVFVADGRSTDRSRDIAERIAAGHPSIHVIDNPRVIQSAGWNIGIAAATGDVIGILGAHTSIARDYVSAAVAALERTGADMVGGPVRARGEGVVGRAIARATSSRFGVGGATFHYATAVSEVDTVYMGLCKREVFDRIGGFDEELVRDQDDEFSYRLRKAGGRIVCDPAIRSEYTCRSSLGDLWTQYFEYGRWKVHVLRRHPKQMRPRQFVPSAFVAGLVGSAALGAAGAKAGRVALGAIVAAYALGTIVASLKDGADEDVRVKAAMAAAFPTLHVAYGTGMLYGLVRAPRARIPNGTAVNAEGEV